MKTFKGFNKDLTCRGFQFEIGKEYEQDGDIKACANGFHACEDPLAVFHYYLPGSSRYCEVEQSGDIDRDGDDTKVASSKIKIGAELTIPALVAAKVEYVKEHTTTEYTDPERATAGEYGAATSRGSASVGENGCALVRGNDVKVRGGLGAVLVVCIENEYNYDVKEWLAFEVDGVNVKADTWYTLKDGKLEEVGQ